MKKIVMITLSLTLAALAAEPEDYRIILTDSHIRLLSTDLNRLAESSSVIKNLVLESEGYEFSLPIA